MTHEEAIARGRDAMSARAADVAHCPWRPAYHFAAPAGWINDPNGLIYHRGEYHLFYQHYPYAPRWGPMHWGHAKSRDLLHWHDLPIALAPSEAYDLSEGSCGCWSGSAVEQDGKIVLMYTGHSSAHMAAETQNIAIGDVHGITFTKYAGNPVIPAFPPEASSDFRDPRVWRHGEYFYVVIGTGRDGIGKVLLYRSRNLASWEYIGVAAQSDGTQGNIWECPDLFEMDGQHVLLFSPTGLGRPLSMYLIGQFSYETGSFTAASCGLIDHGADFYAPQTMLGPGGRRIMIGWMQAWGAKVPTEQYCWSGAMTLPRELRVRDGRLLQFPAREVEALRGDGRVFAHSMVAGEVIALPGSSEVVELRLSINAAEDCTSAGVRVRCSADGREFTEIRWSPAEGRLTLDRLYSGEGDRDERSAALSGRAISLRVFLDRSSVEVFTEDGRVALTSRVYPSRDSMGMRLFCEGGSARFEGTAWPIRP